MRRGETRHAFGQRAREGAKYRANLSGSGSKASPIFYMSTSVRWRSDSFNSPRVFALLCCSWGGACLALAWRDPTLTSMADAGAFGEGAGESDYAESTDKLEGFLNSFEDEDIHGQVGRSVRLGSGSEPGQGRGRAWGSGSQWCARAWPHHTRCTR